MKRISTHIISLLCLTLFSTTVQGATHTVSKITSTDNIIKGCVYLITYKPSSNYYYFVFQKRYGRDTFSAFSSSEEQTEKYNSNVDEVIKKSNLVKIYKNKDDKWCLYDIKTKKFIGVTEISQNKYLTEMDNVQENYQTGFLKNVQGGPAYYFKPEGSTNDYCLTIDGSSEYGLTNKNSIGNVNMAQYYRIADYGFYLDENTDFPIEEPRINPTTTQLPTTATLDITLSNDYYNTLMLPCDVSNYKTVFGNGAEAYEVGTVNSEQIVFTPVEGNSLAANKPYILKGSFNAGPYKLSGITLNTENINNGIMTYSVEGDSFNGVYASGTDLKNSDSYVLYNNKFYSCKKQDAMPIRLFRWYYQSATSSGKRLVIDTNPTGIKTVENGNGVKTDNRFFKLDGTCAGSDFESLPNGIYINNGKKIIK